VKLKYSFLFLLSSAFVIAEDKSTLSSSEQNKADTQPVLPSDFFAGALADATAISDEAGKQRLIDVKSTTLSPALAFGSSFKYINNPEKNSLISRKRDGSALDVSLTFTMGLGEYGLFDFAVCAPSLMLMHMRTYNDPNKDFGEEMEAYDVDVQIAGLSLPFVLPHDFTVSLGHTYVVPSQFRNSGNILSYSNTPNLTIARPITLPNGGILALTTGFSYTFSEGDSPSEVLGPSEQILRQSGIYDTLLSSMLLNNPANLQNGFAHNIGLSYPINLNDQLSITPNANYSKMYYDKGSNDGRRDTTYLVGATASYKVTDWMSLTGLANYTSKVTNGNLSPEFKDFTGGITVGFNRSF
jgi:hypothetical protein